ncbi:MAG: DUF1501 domain-containing protein [Planctomycetes bacterium]|nr:DUF1501 domain-containing protein [Planctomycetota bacterium]
MNNVDFYQREIPRRDLLQLGSLGLVGLSLPKLLQASSGFTTSGKQGRAKSCILFFLEGGPAHQDMWDMKPNAPLEYRGEFQPISSTLNGVPVCEHLPMLAQQMHHLSLIRSVHHTVVDHNAGTYYMLTGRSPVSGAKLIIRDEPDNFPPFGSVLAKLRPLKRLPEFVHLPEIMSNLGYDIPGERAGFLGTAYDPLVAGDPSAPGYRIPGLSFPNDVNHQRLDDRRQLLERLDRTAGLLQKDTLLQGMGDHYEKAFTLLGSSETRDAFDLSQEPQKIRERYGLPDRVDRSVEARKFGGLPHLGQCLLLTRRLIEAGVRLVTVCTGRRIDQTWDGHRKHFSLLRQSILPYFDRAFSALLEDMSERGLLEETLVVAMGEFGRTPKMGQVTSNAGATAAGRDHWPHCYTVLMAGGGIQPGTVYGESDREAAYPKSNPVTPEDIAATIYTALGIDPETRIIDSLNRPQHLALGKPILDLFG